MALLANTVIAGWLIFELVRLLSSYWRFFRMGTAGGNGMFIQHVVIPTSALMFGITVAAVFYLARRRQWTPLRTGVAGALALVIVFSALATVEILRGVSYPSETGEPVDVLGFIQWYIGDRM